MLSKYGCKPENYTITQVRLLDILNAAWYSRMLSTQADELKKLTDFYQSLFAHRANIILEA